MQECENHPGLSVDECQCTHTAAPLDVRHLVVHCKRSAYDIYIGRPSKWGNPFGIGPYKGRWQVATRKRAISCYREWIMSQPDLLAQLSELRGKVLGCWCAPQDCHGRILAELANRP